MNDIDKNINWVSFYSKYLNKPKSCGQDKMHACCPFHSETHPSFWFNTRNGLYKCEGCGASGNATVFLSQIKGITPSEAYKELSEMAGVSTTQKEQLEYTVDMYAAEKCLNVEWLKSEVGITNGSDRSGKYIKLPYKDRSEKQVAVRKRYNPKKKPYFKWTQGSKLCLYGLWKLQGNEEYLVLVEGESDTQSLWMMDFNACGVPGASNFKADWCTEINNIPKIYLHIEPDQGGQTFLNQMTKKLYKGGYNGDVYTFNLNEYGVKDPSELYIKNGTDAEAMVRTAISRAEKLDIKSVSEDIPELVSGIPVKLREPEGWKLSEDGIEKYDRRSGIFIPICKTPIILTKRIHNINTEEEKIEIAIKRSGIWRHGRFLISSIYQSNKITDALAPMGAIVSSTNAKDVVAFLAALESENVDIITEVQGTKQLGWVDDEHFLPFDGGDIVLDVESSMQSRIAGYSRAGSFEDWKTVMAMHRGRNRFRFIIAASFATPLMKILNQRTFFVYNWGGSEGGKTAALRAALSVWGNPQTLVASFYATDNGLERLAGFCKDLPLGLNERQLKSNFKSLDEIIYKLAEGASKLRATKYGGLQNSTDWRTIIIANGEVEIDNSASQTGVTTRVIEITGAPFENKSDASDMYPFTDDNHGYAGPEFLKRLIAANKNEIKTLHEEITAELKQKSWGKSATHIQAIATITTADVLVSEWIFDMDADGAKSQALNMGAEILAMQPSDEERDVNRRALGFIVDWIQKNRERFATETNNVVRGDYYGFEEAGTYFILPTVLEKALTDEGYFKKKVRKYLCGKKIISPETQRKRINSMQKRYIDFDYNMACAVLEGDASAAMVLTEVDDIDPDELPFKE